LRYGTLSAPKPLPFQAWSRAQAKHCRQHLNPGNALPFDIGEPDYDFWGMRERPNRFKDTMTERFTVEREVTAKLFGICNNALRTEPIELLLSAVIHSFSRIFPERRAPAVFNEGHGREPWHASINLSRTVGWLTTLYPLWVGVDDREDVVKTIRHTKDQRRRIPNNGWSYFTSRFLHPEGSKAFVKHSEMEVLFNYEGIYQQLERNDALFRQLPWATSRILSECGGQVRRLTLLEITATVKQGILHFCFEYNCHMSHMDRVKHWVRECESTLREAVVQLAQRSIEYTLSDFPLLPLSYTALARFVSTTLPGIGVLKAGGIEDAYPCSSSQQGMLVSQAKQPTLYHMQIAREVIPLEGQGSADAQRFGVAWQKVVDRHPILRTVFVENMCDDGNFGQVVLKKVIAAVRYVQRDHDDDDETSLAKTLSDCCSNGAGECRPPHRLTIYTMSGGRILLNLEINHTIMDGISLSLIFRDLSLAYDNMLPRGPGPLYRNFISYIQGQNATIGIEYWRQYVKNVIPCYFPVLDQGINRQTGSGTIDVALDAFRLRTFCQQCGVSIYNVLRTAWALLLSSYLGEDDVCFGCIGSGREIPIPDVQDAVGPYISMLICRVRFNPTESISKVLHRVHNDFLSSLPYQHACNLAEIQHELRMRGKPLFNSGISVQKWQTESWKSGTFKFRDVKWEDPSEVRINLNIR
jgi:non-ribosomal peptide synthase protein (TIGR01720 family)